MSAGDRLRRFARLERPRREEPGGEAGLPAPERFGAPGQAAGSGRAPFATRTDASAGRSELPPADASAGRSELPPATPTATSSPARARFLRPDLRAPDVAPAPEGAQPFVRCPACETDHSVYATRCTTCGAPLDTAEVRAFNDALWAERRRAQEEEERVLAERRAAREQAEADAAQARREMGELLASETARRERERLEADGWREPRWGDGDARPLLLRLLGAIRDPRRRLLAILALLGVVVGLVAWAMLARSGALVFYVVLAIVAALLGPTRRRRRWWG